MKKWQRILSEHHNIENISETQTRVLNVLIDTTNNNAICDDIVTRIECGYTDTQGYSYKSIYEYLGY